MKKLFALILCLVTSGVAHAGLISTRSTAPTTCTVGDIWINPGAATNDRIYTCTATNTWTKNSGRPWVIQSTAPSDLSLIWFDDDQVSGYLVLKLHNGTTWVEQAIGEGGTFNQAGDYTLSGSWDFTGATVTGISGGSMVYPGAGIPVSTGSAWGTSITPGTGVVTALAAPVDGTGGLASKASLDALPSIVFGAGITVAENTPSAGTDTVSITPNTYQAYDADWLGVTANGAALISAANYAAMRALLDLEVDVDFNAYDADLATWASVTPGTGVATALAANTGSTGGVPTIIASGAYTVDTASISANTCASAVAVTASGVTTTDTVIATPNAILSSVTGFGVTTAGAVRVDVYPTSGNVNFQFCNPTGTAIDPGSVTFNWKVLR